VLTLWGGCAEVGKGAPSMGRAFLFGRGGGGVDTRGAGADADTQHGCQSLAGSSAAAAANLRVCCSPEFVMVGAPLLSLKHPFSQRDKGSPMRSHSRRAFVEDEHVLAGYVVRRQSVWMIVS